MLFDMHILPCFDASELFIFLKIRSSETAFEFVLGQISNDVTAANIFGDYIDFVRATPV